MSLIPSSLSFLISQVDIRRATRSLVVASSSASSRDDQLYALLDEISQISRGEELNLNSPRQVSKAIFGTIQSTSREHLRNATITTSLGQQQRLLANLVLRYRDLQSQRRYQASATATAAPINKEDVVEEEIVDENAIAALSSPTILELSPHDSKVESLFEKRCKVHQIWETSLVEVTKPSARLMIQQLDGALCPMGYDPQAFPYDPLRGSSAEGKVAYTTAGKKGSLLAYVREQKERFPECVLLIRVGEFYESFGLDAVLLVEHCGLNAMAGKCRAGCPLRNIQATIDCLTSKGFKVAVYEEATDTDASPGPGTRSKLKTRMLGQIVTSANPTYLYDLVLQSNSDSLATSTSPESRSYVGVIHSASGYTMVDVSMEERSVRVIEQLTPEAVACRLAAYVPMDPLIYIGEERSHALPFLSRTSRIRVKSIPTSVVEATSTGKSGEDRAKSIVLRALLNMVETSDDKPLGEDDFQIAISEKSDHGSIQTRPLYLETATQIGLMGDKTIPSLVSSLLPDSAPAACRRFLRRWLLNPPPPTVTDAMSILITSLKEQGQAFPPTSVPPVGKVVALLRAGQASAHVFGELLITLDSTLEIMQGYQYVDAIMTLLQHESGIAADPDSIRGRCLDTIEVIETVVSPIHHVKKVDSMDSINDCGELIPRAFFERNEAHWKGRVHPDVCHKSYDRVKATSRDLAHAVAADFWLLVEDDLSNLIQECKKGKSPIVQDIFNNIFALKAIPADLISSEDYFQPRDRNGKLLKNRYTTARVQEALSNYVTACDEACRAVTTALTSLSHRLCNDGHLPAIVQAAHFNLIIATACHHASQANTLGWSIPTVIEANEEDECAASFCSVWPHWMDKSSSIANTFSLDGMFLLTAPNMSGKSTLMRATAAAALLSACGLAAPLHEGSTIRRFDNIFVRGASSDVPSENLSAFGAEVLDIAALLRTCTRNSIVFVDEIGRGTSPRDGTSIAAAVLEEMAKCGMSGVFATHLHDILDLPIDGKYRIKNKRMAVNNAASTPSWTYHMEDGVCTDSLAMLTAARFGFPASIIERANLFAVILDSPEKPAVDNRQIACVTPELVQSKNLKVVVAACSQVTGADEMPVLIPPSWSSPPSLEGKACVYVLTLKIDNGSSQLYVGETGSISRRLREHRARGGAWESASAAVWAMHGGKRQARNLESLLIQHLAQLGYHLVSTKDGMSIKPSLRT